MLNSISRRLILVTSAVLSVAVITGCAASASNPGGSSKTSSTEKTFFAQIYHENGRTYMFGDVKNYKQFLAVDEVTYTRTKIGAGKSGETIIYALTKDESKKLVPGAAERFFTGQVTDAPSFYGEVIKHGRFHVFGSFEDMKAFLASGEVPLTYTEIGTGPKGATVIYALNKKTAKQKPTALVAEFKAFHGLK